MSDSESTPFAPDDEFDAAFIATVKVFIREFADEKDVKHPYAVVESNPQSIGECRSIKWQLQPSDVLPNAVLVSAKGGKGGSIENRVVVVDNGRSVVQKISVNLNGRGEGMMDYNLRYKKDKNQEEVCEVLGRDPTKIPQCIDHDEDHPILGPNPPPQVVVP